MTTAPAVPPFLRLDHGGTCLVLDLRRGGARLVHLGAPLPESENLVALALASSRWRHESQPDHPPLPSLLPQAGQGGMATAAVRCLRLGQECETSFNLIAATQQGSGLQLQFADAFAGIQVELRWQLHDTGMVSSHCRLTNTGTTPLTVVRLASLALPLPGQFTQVVRFPGRWAAEMREERVPLARGLLAAVSHGGRPGFSGAQWVRLEGEDATETRGAVLGAHLAWSGDHELVIERDADNESRLLLAARIDIGEVILAPNEVYAAPEALFHCGEQGRYGLRTVFHRHALEQVLPRSATSTPRKVHLNTWEALYFNQSLPDLCSLADTTAALGIERFVLDDGWFHGRRDDTTSLGDWTPDATVFPEGLSPLIAHVQALGMDFGLWVEPEMVSPDSDLYRQHPDWCIALPGQPRPTQRHQLVLDLSKAEVTNHVFSQLDALLRPGNIAYLKWDHNRELFPLAGRSQAQALAHYALLDRLRAAHPAVEIETCASGGGRVDLGVLQRCSRFWASDNNDPIERLAINLGWFQFLPPRVAGNHVGPSPNPITGRQSSMHFRARVALFGHMGVEADPRRMPSYDFAMLQQHIAFYREWRDVLHEGAWSIPECSEPGVYGWLAMHEGRGLALAAQTRLAGTYDVPALRFTTLNPNARYRVKLPEPWPEKAQRYLAAPEQWREGVVLSGTALATTGLALPLAQPETAWLVTLEQLP